MENSNINNQPKNGNAPDKTKHGLVFDGSTPELVRPQDFNGTHEKICDVCIITFSHTVVEKAMERFACEQVAHMGSVCDILPVYVLTYKGKKIAFFMSTIGSTAAGICMEETNCLVGATKFVMFGSCGALDSRIPSGGLIVPDEAYRDEGFSYHYAPPSDYIRIKNADRVAALFDARGIPYTPGKTWTTDGLYRETSGKAALRRAEGCVAVEMECAGAQAVCDFRGWEFYDFLFAGDLLEGESWEARIIGGAEEIDHQLRYFLLALELAATV